MVDHRYGGKLLNELEGISSLPVPIFNDMGECLSAVHADVLIDLTTPEVGMQHTKTALEFGVRPVVGTTGFTKENLQELRGVMPSKRKRMYHCSKLCIRCCFNDEILTISWSIFSRCRNY